MTESTTQTAQAVTQALSVATPDAAHDAATTYTAEVPGWTPAFPGQREPFRVGNTLSLRAGTYSPRVFGPRARELAAGVLAARPDLASSAAAVVVWATYFAQFETEASKPDPNEATLLRFGNAATAIGSKLGLDPTSFARLTRDQAAAFAYSATGGAELIAQRMAAGLAAIAARDERAAADELQDDDHDDHDNESEG